MFGRRSRACRWNGVRCPWRTETVWVGIAENRLGFGSSHVAAVHITRDSLVRAASASSGERNARCDELP